MQGRAVLPLLPCQKAATETTNAHGLRERPYFWNASVSIHIGGTSSRCSPHAAPGPLTARREGGLSLSKGERERSEAAGGRRGSAAADRWASVWRPPWPHRPGERRRHGLGVQGQACRPRVTRLWGRRVLNSRRGSVDLGAQRVDVVVGKERERATPCRVASSDAAYMFACRLSTLRPWPSGCASQSRGGAARKAGTARQRQPPSPLTVQTAARCPWQAPTRPGAPGDARCMARSTPFDLAHLHVCEHVLPKVPPAREPSSHENAPQQHCGPVPCSLSCSTLLPFGIAPPCTRYGRGSRSLPLSASMRKQ